MNHRDHRGYLINFAKLYIKLIILFIIIFLDKSIFAGAAIIKTRTDVIIKGSPGLSLNQPSDIAVSRAGDIYILDGVNNRVVVFDASGNFKFQFGKKGNAPGNFIYPLGITIDDKEKVYVADSQNHRVQIFSIAGEYINNINIKQSAVQGSKEADPTDVVVLENKIYISDNDNHRIVVYDRNTLEFAFEWGKNGFLEGDFRYPFMMATNGVSKLYVIDVINARLQAFTPRGEYLHSIGQFGIKEGTFFRPKGVAIDVKKRVFVTDLYTGAVQVFNEDGVLLGIVGNEFGKIKKFNTPFGIAIDSQNNLYISEMFINTVSKIKILE